MAGYVQIVESWALGTPKAEAEGPALTVYGEFPSDADARAHTTPLIANPHLSHDVRVVPLTAPLPAADSPEGQAMIRDALIESQMLGGRKVGE
jgi:hypothetical protein